MFDESFKSCRSIISNIAIIGYSESSIISRGINTTLPLDLTCLYIYPSPDEYSYNQMTYEMMFPDKNYNIECPKFFSLCLTNEYGDHSYLYCLKFPEKYILEIKHSTYEIIVPLVICIKSNKSDLEPFRKLLTSINQIIVSDNIDYEPSIVNNYKKVELLNIFYFIFSLPNISPHSLVRLKLNNELCEVENEINFYFSSNCEIPCNENDTDINLLFLLLDQSIIIKVIIAILGEKQIIFRASQSYLLHLIIPTFLKLIFPFKWQQKFVTVLPNDEVDNYLDTPGSFIFGILSNVLNVQQIKEKYPGKIIVDCDSNEIFGDEETKPFSPEKCNDDLLAHNKKKKDFFNNVEGGIKQGKNIFVVDGSFIYQYDPENINGKGKKMKFGEKNFIIIDTINSQFLIHNNNNDFITSKEIKWLRKNFQMIRNPEIFDIENIKIKNKNSNKNNYFNDDSLVLPNRPFSYNIQNILMHFYLDKISDSESKFMEYFKNTNLYLNYKMAKKYQNNSGKKIIENIKDTMNNQRSIENCFIVEFNKKIFSALALIDDIDKKLLELKPEEKNLINKYNNLKNILMNYCVVLGINNNNNIDNININNININNEKEKMNDFCMSVNVNQIRTKVKHFKNPIKKGHIKSNSLLQFSLNQNTNFNLAGIDKSSKDYFKFYKKDGFLNFVKNITDLNKNLGDIHKLEIFKELFNKYKTLENIFKDQEEEKNQVFIDVFNENFEEEEEENEENNNNEIILKNGYDKNNKNKKQLLLEELQISTNLTINFNEGKKLSQIDENEEESINNNNDSFIEKKVVPKNSIDIKDSNNANNELLGNIIINGIKLGETFMSQSQNEESSNNIYKSENNIIIFPDNDSYNENKENEKENFIDFEDVDANTNKISNKKNKNLTQYYLFLAFYLEEISHTKELLDLFNKEILKSVGTKISIYKLILKLYKEAYKFSGEKHRDFPYYSFYSFLDELNGKILEKIEKNLSEDDYNFDELLEIYYFITKKKNIKIHKHQENTSDRSTKRANTLNENENNKSLNIIGDYIKESRISHNDSVDFISKSLQISFTKSEKEDFKEVNIINKDFEPLIEPKSLHILNEFCTLICSCFPSEEDIKTKSPYQILEEVHTNINSPTLKEFLAELKKMNLSELKTHIDKLCFWLNCFNFLVLFSIFYLKPNLVNQNFWENFFKSIQYNIGGNVFSFEDMLFILFKKNIFFPKNKYSPKDYVKKNLVDLSKDKTIPQEYVFVTALLLYLPTKEFYKPIIYEKNEIQNLITMRLYNSTLNLIKWNKENKTLSLNGLSLILGDDFVKKGYTKYKPYIKEEIYDIMKRKKYKKMTIKQMNWELSFDNLLNYTFVDE